MKTFYAICKIVVCVLAFGFMWGFFTGMANSELHDRGLSLTLGAVLALGFAVIVVAFWSAIASSIRNRRQAREIARAFMDEGDDHSQHKTEERALLDAKKLPRILPVEDEQPAKRRGWYRGSEEAKAAAGKAAETRLRNRQEFLRGEAAKIKASKSEETNRFLDEIAQNNRKAHEQASDPAKVAADNAWEGFRVRE